MNTESDNLPAIVAITTGAVFVLVSVLIAMNTNVKANEPRAAATTTDSQATSTSLLQLFNYDVVPETDTEATTTSPSSTSNHCSQQLLNTNLETGDRGPAVRDLQEFLNADPDTRIASAGSGSSGEETNYYGLQTAQAVIRFQEKYLGSIEREAGVWGLQERMQAREVCEDMPTDTTYDDTVDNQSDTTQDQPEPNTQSSGQADNQDQAVDTENDFSNYQQLEENLSDDDRFADRITTRDRLFGGEAFLADFDLRGRGRVREAETNTIADIRFKSERGDVMVERVDISFVAVGSDGDDEPWEVIESISIESDREQIASVSADSKDGWSDDGSDYSGSLAGDEQFTIRLSNLDTIIKQDDRADLSINITLQDSVDDAGEDVRWGVFVDNEDLLAVDSEGVRHRIGDDEDTSVFRIYEAREGQDDGRLRVERSYSDPESSAISVPAAGRSPVFSIFAFDIEARDTQSSVETITLQVETKGVDRKALYRQVVNDARLRIDEDIIPIERVSARSAQANKSIAKLTFTLADPITIGKYRDKTVRLLVRFNPATGNYESGTILRASVPTDGIEAGDGQSSEGSVAGEWHVLDVR